jgi:beta-N-acetylhexosaminidase
LPESRPYQADITQPRLFRPGPSPPRAQLLWLPCASARIAVVDGERGRLTTQEEVHVKSYMALLIVVILVMAISPAAWAQIRGFGLAETVDHGPDDAAESVVGGDDDSEGNADSEESAAPVERWLEDMDLRERVAQLMLVTLQGAPAPDASDRALIKDCTPGGVIVAHVAKPITAAEYVNMLRAAALKTGTGIPLLIGTNLYALPSDRTGKGGYFSQLPSLLSIASAGESDGTERLARLLAAHLDLMGFNMHVGPALHLAPGLAGLKGSIQCFGSNPEFVAESAGVLIRTLEDSGVIVMPVGFPGGGLNRAGNAPAVLSTPRAFLAERDLLPYLRAIEEGAGIIHVGTVLAPGLVPEVVPACLSDRVLSDLLRHELGFDGVIVAGPMDTADVARKHDPSEAAILALQAGADMILWHEAGQRVLKSVDEIVRAVKGGLLSQDVVDASVRRVLKLKVDRNIAGRPMPMPREAEKLSRKRTYIEEAYEIERRAITLVQNRNQTLPLSNMNVLPLGVTGVAGVDALHNALEEYLKAVSRQSISTAKHSGGILDFEIRRLTERIEGLKTVVITLTPEFAERGARELIGAFQSKKVRVVVVLLGYPYNLDLFGDADAIVLAYCDPLSCSETMRAVADVLVGEGPIGILPVVRDMKTQVGETQVYSVLDVIRSPAGRLPITVAEPFVAGLAVPSDPTAAIKKAEWDFGDGTRMKGLRVERAFSAPGRYPIMLTVTDSKKQVTSQTFHAVVE